MGLLKATAVVGVASIGAGIIYAIRSAVSLKRFATPRGHKGGIVISGASSGIGRHAAEHLSALGFTVFAGVRRMDADYVSALRSAGCVPLQLDVTDPASVAAAALLVESTLTAAGLPLVALCNSAGVGGAQPVELEEPEHARRLLDVNCVSLFSMYRHFVPLLRASAGVGGCARVVNTGSTSGFVSTAGDALYAMSQHAVEALSDASRLELARFGIAVSVINAGQVRAHRTPHAAEEEAAPSGSDFINVRASEGDKVRSLYADITRRNVDAVDDLELPSAEVTTAAIVHAITAPRPSPRYVVAAVGGVPAWLVVGLQWALPTPAMDRLLLWGMERREKARLDALPPRRPSPV